MSPLDGRPLPAHRFEERKKKDKGNGKSRTWVFDYDGTITGAPDQLARVAQGLKKLGDYIIVLTGNPGNRDQLVSTLKDWDFPFDDFVQYQDDDTDGLARAQHLKQFKAWGAFDNRIDRAYTFAKVCPHMYVIVKTSSEDQDQAKKAQTKKAAKKAAKKLSRSAEHHAAYPPDDIDVPEGRTLEP